MNKDILWVERYRPSTVDELILPESIKNTFKEIVSQDKIPNLILSGSPGTGKTSAAIVLCKELDCDYIIINGSDEGRLIETLRNKLTQYCSSVSMSGGRKVVIIDEADYMTPDSVQPAMRGFIEKFSSNCSFIFTCNFKNRIIEPIHSRCAVIDYSSVDPKKMANEFLQRCFFILTENKIQYEEKVVVELILKHFPDFRRVLNELQRYSVSGKIDSGILLNISDTNMNELIDSLKSKNFKSVRAWVVNNLDNDPQKVYRKIYDKLYEKCDPSTIPATILVIAEYQYKSAFVADQEINLMACLVEIMSNAKFK
ncbi:MAG: AAA family ATPase [bacterium TMED46]|nr:MAG: AAA family ATPase [bacterium TMED46]